MLVLNSKRNLSALSKVAGTFGALTILLMLNHNMVLVADAADHHQHQHHGDHPEQQLATTLTTATTTSTTKALPNNNKITITGDEGTMIPPKSSSSRSHTAADIVGNRDTYHDDSKSTTSTTTTTLRRRELDEDPKRLDMKPWREIDQMVYHGDPSPFSFTVANSENILVVGGYAEIYVYENKNKNSIKKEDECATKNNFEWVDTIPHSARTRRSRIPIALSEDGTILVAGNPNRYPIFIPGLVLEGEVYVHERNPASGKWSKTTRLAARDNSVLYDRDTSFGTSVAISGTTIVVGAVRKDNGRREGASIYVYEKDKTTGAWLEVGKLWIEGRFSSRNGLTVKVSEGTIVAVGDAVNVFEKNASGLWSEAGQLQVSDSDASSRSHHEPTLGQSRVDISGDLIVVAVPEDGYDGSVYVFEKVAPGNWSEAAKIVAPNGSDDSCQYMAQFGVSVAISERTIIVHEYRNVRPTPGAPGSIDTRPDSSAAYVFEMTKDGTWSNVGQLDLASTPERSFSLKSFDISDGIVSLGMIRSERNGSIGGITQSVHLFSRVPTSSSSSCPNDKNVCILEPTESCNPGGVMCGRPVAPISIEGNASDDKKCTSRGQSCDYDTLCCSELTCQNTQMGPKCRPLNLKDAVPVCIPRAGECTVEEGHRKKCCNDLTCQRTKSGLHLCRPPKTRVKKSAACVPRASRCKLRKDGTDDDNCCDGLSCLETPHHGFKCRPV